ncbi:acyl-CoA thioesterase II [Weeksellaceae bacterium TAE3-ERU29]|nr:acyl-CoA thioesterase II [Weeksellaceae bacterium TAE3-ERU29]
MKDIKVLKELIKMERVDEFTYIGKNEPIGSPIVFGGQVLAQGLYAMSQSVPEERIAHSLHSYFILPGDLNKPIRYEVEYVRDGGSFSTRRVKAIQGGEVIFFMGGSFQVREEGYKHQIKMPDVAPPEELKSWDETYSEIKDFLPKEMQTFFGIDRPIIFKPAVEESILEQKDREPFQNIWFKIKGTTENNPLENRAILAYISDYNLLFTALRPHSSKANIANTVTATIDHAMWFYQDADINDWFLYALDSPGADGGRGFTRGNIFNRKGELIASVAQEGLIRKKNRKK